MSEYQYYEFLAVDRPLDNAARTELRAISTRARITATSFTNTYEWGDFKGDPAKLMARWFDVHVYLANWGSRRLMIRLPARLVPQWLLDAVIVKDGPATATIEGTNLVLDIYRDEVGLDDWDDGAGWLASLLPLRSAAMAGDHGLFQLLWLLAVEEKTLPADQCEPLPGLGPLTAAHEAFAGFFGMDMDLVQAAADRGAKDRTKQSAAAIRERIAAMPEKERIEMLSRLAEGGAEVAIEIKATLLQAHERDRAGPVPDARSIRELLARAGEIRAVRERAQEEADAARRKRAAEEEAKARRTRLDQLERRGERAWEAVEAEIQRRNPQGYDRAAELLADLHALAGERGTTAAFFERLRAIHERHARKGQFIKRLASLG